MEIVRHLHTEVVEGTGIVLVRKKNAGGGVMGSGEIVEVKESVLMPVVSN